MVSTKENRAAFISSLKTFMDMVSSQVISETALQQNKALMLIYVLL